MSSFLQVMGAVFLTIMAVFTLWILLAVAAESRNALERRNVEKAVAAAQRTQHQVDTLAELEAYRAARANDVNGARRRHPTGDATDTYLDGDQ